MPKSNFNIEEIAKYPAPGNSAPNAFAFSPDNTQLTFLFSPERTLSRQLYALNLKTGEQRPFTTPLGEGTTEENVTIAEALRRERQRQMTTGITQYEWANNGGRVLIPLPDGLYVQDGLNASPRRVLAVTDTPALDPRFSPDGKWISYVQDAELYIISSKGGAPRQITHGARGTGKTNGLAEYIAQEEMGRFEGYWWSPDSKWLAFEEVDETHIPIYRIVHQGKSEVGDGAQEDHHYPFAGKTNAKVRLGVVPIEGGTPTWMDFGVFEYLARVQWLSDGRLTAQLQNREQTRLDLVVCDIKTGACQTLLTETSEVWINLHNMLRSFDAHHPKYPGGFIWASERTGFQHLYLYDRDGKLINPITSGEWMVESIAGVDVKNEIVYFTGRMDSALESHLYAVQFAGDSPRRITSASGMHTVWLDRQLKLFVDLHDSPTQAPHVTLRRLSNGSKVHEIYANDDPRVKTFRLRPPEFVSITNRAGVILHGALYRARTRSKKPLPTIVYVYGGPHAQMVAHSWTMTASMRVQYLRNQGFHLFVLDNRGSAKRGLAFEGAIKHDMGNFEVQDQLDGVRWLVEQGIADPERIGVYGWSYGGYMSAMCLARAPEAFKLAVAGAPVTHWDGYDTHYTECYMGTPQSNPEGYQISNVMAHIDKMTGKLLIVHGLIDENVHFRHTARLINALIRARKAYDLLLFPNERHSPRRLEDRVFMEEQIRDYFIEYL